LFSKGLKSKAEADTSQLRKQIETKDDKIKNLESELSSLQLELDKTKLLTSSNVSNASAIEQQLKEVQSKFSTQIEQLKKEVEKERESKRSIESTTETLEKRAHE